MNIQEAKQEIARTLKAYFTKDENGNYAVSSIRQRPILLIGAPGIGKTQIMEQVAEENQVGLVAYTITHHTRQSAIGLPLIEKKQFGGTEYSITEYTMSEIIASVYEAIEQYGHKEGILFLDEVNCVSETLAPTMLQFLQAKTFGRHKLPEGWLIVAAGNPPEYNKSVREFDVVTLDRLRRIDVEPDFEAWKNYAKKKLLHPSILAYLSIKPQYFCKIETTIDGRFFVTPRGWEDLSELIYSYERLHADMTRDIVGEYLQYPAVSKDFANYLELYYKYENQYRVDEILDGRINESLCEKLAKAAFDEKMSVIALLLARLSALCKGLEQRAAVLQEMKKQYGKMTERPENSTEEERTAFKADFSKKSDAYEDAFDETGLRLEHAFDFMEAAFGTGQEMVLFMTELNYNYYLIRFLKDYNCERYYQYNKNLLFEEQEEKIREKLAQI